MSSDLDLAPDTTPDEVLHFPGLVRPLCAVAGVSVGGRPALHTRGPKQEGAGPAGWLRERTIIAVAPWLCCAALGSGRPKQLDMHHTRSKKSSPRPCPYSYSYHG